MTYYFKVSSINSIVFLLITSLRFLLQTKAKSRQANMISSLSFCFLVSFILIISPIEVIEGVSPPRCLIGIFLLAFKADKELRVVVRQLKNFHGNVALDALELAVAAFAGIGLAGADLVLFLLGPAQFVLAVLASSDGHAALGFKPPFVLGALIARFHFILL